MKYTRKQLMKNRYIFQQEIVIITTTEKVSLSIRTRHYLYPWFPALSWVPPLPWVPPLQHEHGLPPLGGRWGQEEASCCWYEAQVARWGYLSAWNAPTCPRQALHQFITKLCTVSRQCFYNILLTYRSIPSIYRIQYQPIEHNYCYELHKYTIYY